MIWQGATLIDDQRSLAETTPDTIVAGGHVLRIASDNPVKFRAFDVDTGEEYLLRKAGLTVSRYAAECAGRRYTLNRAGFDFLAGAVAPKREIRDAYGELVAVTRGFPSGDLGVDVGGGADGAGGGLDAAPFLDLVFMSWALTFVDAPTRRTRY